ncbi:unnamed protein product [Larinioides sclopetarius]|uniref:RING-type domain-containing protein n=1 Tax=Larinioides sclopetarius TaxID=280406 RepID=A0AAV1YVR2_9ARAC
MPFWNDSKAQNYKAKLEHKMCMAKEAPDQNFDLSDCNLSEIPPGVFSMCRVFRKEALLLQNNHISNLSSGGSLKDLNQLQVLDLENNQLKKLPASFEKLANLCHLNLKNNKLLQFPVPICSLHSLEYLNLCDNPKIKYLPKELCNLTSLKDLEINVEHFIYPNPDVCMGGIENIMKFLCDEMGTEYAPPTPKSLSSAATPDEELSDTDRRKSMDFSPLSERRQQELIVMEEALKENFAVQSSINANSSERRKKLLEDIALEQDRMESEIMLLQTKKEKEKKNLLDVLTNIENHSAKLIDQLMLLNDRTTQVEKMAAVLERDRIENEEIFSIKQEKLEQMQKKEILVAMTEMLKCEEKYGKYEAEKFNLMEQLQNEENESNWKLYNIFQERELDQQILINRLLEEEQYQKEAFEALQLQKDIQHQEIAHQIHLIEKELSNLTVAEIKKKDLKIDSEMNVLADHRIALASLLSDLMAAKQQRELELKERLQQMELKRAQEMEDFWLIQYQKLLDRKPKGVIAAELGLDKDVKSILLDVPAIEYLPLFASKRISLSTLLKFTTKDLKKMGILDDEVCEAILNKARKYFKNMQAEEKYFLPEFSDVPEPSAPPEPSTPTEPEEVHAEPTAPPLSPDDDTKLWCQTECVICLDVQTSSVFLPCGHVCCCRDCSKKVELCPMCRTTISSRFILTVS